MIEVQIRRPCSKKSVESPLVGIIDFSRCVECGAQGDASVVGYFEFSTPCQPPSLHGMLDTCLSEYVDHQNRT